jgi:uncharacterized protein
MSARPTLGRRGWLAGVGVAAAAVPLGLWLHERPPPRYFEGRFGALRPDPRGVLDLLEGFSCRVLERAGDRMSDGHAVPRRPDAMACFEASDGGLVVMRNHELPAGLRGRFFGAPGGAHAYDPHGAGGVTRLVLDPHTLQRRSSNFVLTGTALNCAGGPSPWGWLSCEETVAPGHGFVFLCDPSADEARPPVRVDAFGRFQHEAAAVDPARGFVYLSEDRADSCLYRFVPHDRGEPFEGRLQALRVRGRDGESTAPFRAGVEREIAWVDVGDATPEEDELRHRARRLGAATFKRGEGLCFAGGAVHLCATTGGPVEGGQIFRVRDEGEGGTLEVLASSTDRAVLDMPDNLTFAPSGTLFVAEDGPGADYVRGVAADGEVFDFARNAASDGEICGPCFSPDGRAMFLNLQDDGLTLAIEGPFDRLA